MHKQFANAFYQSKAWRKARAAYIKSTGGLCEECLKQGMIKPAEEVHHIIELTPENLHNPQITMAPDNLMALCADCHKQKRRSTKRWRVDADGRVAPLR